MTIKFNVPGSKRKELVKTIAAWLGEDIKYCGAPTFAYEIDYFTVDREGNLIFDDRADSEVTERLLEHLYDEGFESDISAVTEKLAAAPTIDSIDTCARRPAYTGSTSYNYSYFRPGNYIPIVVTFSEPVYGDYQLAYSFCTDWQSKGR